jgi:hypothetical protein
VTDTKYVSWRIDGPHLNSYADDGGYLGVDYTIDVDTRWNDLAMLSPQRNVVDLSTHDSGGTLENAHKGVHATGSSLEWIYILRGSRPAKVRLDTMALVNSGIFTTEVMTDVLVTKSENGTYEVTFACDNTTLLVVTTIGSTTDTTSNNDETQEFRILGRGAKKGTSQQIIGLGGNAHHQGIYSNIMSGSVTMDASAWTLLTTLMGDDLTFTGFGLDEDYQIIGTSKGPYYFNENRLTYWPMFEQMRMDESLEHCRVIAHWYALGAIICLRDGLRWFKAGSSESFGIQRYFRNTSPVRGRPTGVAGDDRWLWVNHYDEENDVTWVTAYTERRPGDPGTEMMVPYVVHKLDGVASRFLTNVGNANGSRTNPAMVGGHDGNMYYFVRGREMAREYVDANYRFQPFGEWYGTEWRGIPRKWKEVKFFEFETENCDADQTITVSVSVDGESYVTLGMVNTNGVQRVYLPTEQVGGWRIKPKLAFAGTATNSPRVRGPLRMGYDAAQDYPVDGAVFP